MRLILLVAVALTVATGCQTSPRVSSHIELLNSEKRVLEDELYDMEYELEDALEELDQLRTENERLNRRLGVLPEPRFSEPRRTDSPSKKSKSSDLNLAPPMIDEGMLTEPKVELPEENSRQRETPRSKPAPMAPAVPMTFISPVESKSIEPGLLSLLPPEVDAKLPSHISAGPERLALDPTDPRVTYLYLDPLLTGGSDFDRQPGDDGIVLVFQPRNQENRFVALAGPISIVLIDPTQDQERARVARWDLDAQDVEQVIHGSNTESGIRLRLPWANGAPPTNRLQLFVRYGTVDGRKLEASREIFVTLPGQISQRWTPRSSGRPRVLPANQTVTHQSVHAVNVLEGAPSESKLPVDVQSGGYSEHVDEALDQNSSSTNAVSPASSTWQPHR